MRGSRKNGSSNPYSKYDRSDIVITFMSSSLDNNLLRCRFYVNTEARHNL